MLQSKGTCKERHHKIKAEAQELCWYKNKNKNKSSKPLTKGKCLNYYTLNLISEVNNYTSDNSQKGKM